MEGVQVAHRPILVPSRENSNCERRDFIMLRKHGSRYASGQTKPGRRTVSGEKKKGLPSRGVTGFYCEKNRESLRSSLQRKRKSVGVNNGGLTGKIIP